VKVGFDLDGTLDRPELAQLARVLYDAGCEIHVITANAIAVAKYYQTREDKEKKLLRLGVLYTELHLAAGTTFSEVGQEKARIIREQGIEVMFDDSTTFCNMMEEHSDAVILRVREPNERVAAKLFSRYKRS